MSVIKGSIAIALNWTTEEQLELVKGMLDLACQEAQEQYSQYPNPNDVPKDIEERWNALQNICCDLDIPGYEMS